MKKHSIFVRNNVILVLILATVVYRIMAAGFLPQWANFTPVGALALFAGTYFKPSWKAYLLPMLLLLVSDIFVNKITLDTYNPFYGGMWGVYLAFAIITAIGILQKRVTVVSVGICSLVSVLVHWVLTDIHPWWVSVPSDGVYYYAKNFSGFVKCLLFALPFEMNFLLGTVLFNVLLFGSFEWLKSRYVSLQTHNELPITVY